MSNGRSVRVRIGVYVFGFRVCVLYCTCSWAYVGFWIRGRIGLFGMAGVFIFVFYSCLVRNRFWYYYWVILVIKEVVGGIKGFVCFLFILTWVLRCCF